MRWRLANERFRTGRGTGYVLVLITSVVRCDEEEANPMTFLSRGVVLLKKLVGNRTRGTSVEIRPRT